MISTSIPTASSPLEQLLDVRPAERGVSRREVATEAAAALLFLVVAVPLAAAPLAAGDVPAGTAVLLCVLYAAVSRIEFALGVGYVVPSILVLVPMLFLLPPAVVPLLVAASLTLGALAQYLTGQGPAERILFSLADATHALGPAVVLAVAGTDGDPAVYAAAFLAGAALDMASAIAREAFGQGVAPRVQGKVVALACLVDAALAPVGYLVALRAQDDLAGVFLIVPFTALLVLFARERRARIAQAHLRLDEATTDALTGLGNRRRLQADLEAAVGGDRPAVLMLFDLDGFKRYNDTFGHLAGDALLKRLAGRLGAACASAGGTAYRPGGDEFCVLLPSVPEKLDATIAAAADALQEEGETFAVGATYGAVLVPHEAPAPSAALQLADERMYVRKQRGSAAGGQAADVLMQLLLASAPALHHHAVEVAALAEAAGRELGMSTDELDELRRAAELRDIARLAVVGSELGHHAVLSERVLRAAPALLSVAAVVRATPERFDGTGTPDGLAGDAIPLAARIIAAAGEYQAMVTHRGVSAAAAVAELRAGAGTRYDPDVVEAVAAVCERADREAGFVADARARTARETAAQLRSALGAV